MISLTNLITNCMFLESPTLFQDLHRLNAVEFFITNFCIENEKHKKKWTSTESGTFNHLQDIRKTLHFNNIFKINFIHKKIHFHFKPSQRHKNTKNMDIHRKLNFYPFSKTQVKPSTLTTFSKSTSLTKKFIVHLTLQKFIQ